MRVTVVNDNPEFLQLMQDLLQDATHPATLIDGDRENVLELIEASEPEVLIIDLRLGTPGLRGLEILREARQRPALRQVPAIVCTAATWALDEIAPELATMEGISVLTKPFPIADLYDLLDQLSTA